MLYIYYVFCMHFLLLYYISNKFFFLLIKLFYLSVKKWCPISYLVSIPTKWKWKKRVEFTITCSKQQKNCYPRHRWKETQTLSEPSTCPFIFLWSALRENLLTFVLVPYINSITISVAFIYIAPEKDGDLSFEPRFLIIDSQ